MTPELIQAATGCTAANAARFAAPLTEAMRRWRINTPVRQAAFLAQIAVESGYLARLEENLNYSVEALLAKFSRQRISVADAHRVGRTATQRANQEAIANLLYGGEWGRKNLGNTREVDGWVFRGRGLKQLTGRANYTSYTNDSGNNVVAYPEMLLQPNLAADSAGWFWHTRGCSGLADRRDWGGLTRTINGGVMGLNERLAQTNTALRVLGAA